MDSWFIKESLKLLLTLQLLISVGCGDKNYNANNPDVVSSIRKIKVKKYVYKDRPSAFEKHHKKLVDGPIITYAADGETVLSYTPGKKSEEEFKTITTYYHYYEFDMLGSTYRTKFSSDQRNIPDDSINKYIDVLLRLITNDRINVGSIADFERERIEYEKNKSPRIISVNGEPVSPPRNHTKYYTELYNELNKETLFEKPCYIDTSFNQFYENKDEGYFDIRLEVTKKSICSFFSRDAPYNLDIRLKNTGWIEVKEVNSFSRYKFVGDKIWDLFSKLLIFMVPLFVLSYAFIVIASYKDKTTKK